MLIHDQKPFTLVEPDIEDSYILTKWGAPFQSGTTIYSFFMTLCMTSSTEINMPMKFLLKILTSGRVLELG